MDKVWKSSIFLVPRSSCVEFLSIGVTWSQGVFLTDDCRAFHVDNHTVVTLYPGTTCEFFFRQYFSSDLFCCPAVVIVMCGTWCLFFLGPLSSFLPYFWLSSWCDTVCSGGFSSPVVRVDWPKVCVSLLEQSFSPPHLLLCFSCSKARNSSSSSSSSELAGFSPSHPSSRESFWRLTRRTVRHEFGMLLI